MTSESFDFSEVERFTAGTVGEPGNRTFYLQASAGSVVVSIKCEKQQVAALSEYLSGVIADLPPTEPGGVLLDLVEPVTAEWTVGMISVAFDQVGDQIVIVIEEVRAETLEAEPDLTPLSDPDAGSLRVRLSRAQVAAFIEHAASLVEAGRPRCPLCGHPRGPDHACPRTNGHGPPT